MDYFDILLAKKLNGGGGGDITIEDLTINANGEYRAPSGKAYGKVTANVPAPANALFKQTLSNLPSPIATINGADAPLDSLKASIEGVQDLHGYDKPWVGGAGKNKFNIDGTVITQNHYIDASGNLVENNLYDITDNILINPSTTYSVGGDSDNNAGAITAVEFNENDEMVARNVYSTRINGRYSGTFTSTATTKYIRIQLAKTRDTDAKMNTIQLELGSTATAYEPYSNICPISGWSSCEVTDNNNTYTIPFKDSSDNPINVYRGTINITTGIATFNRIVKIYNGSEGWKKSSTYDGSFYLPASAVSERKPDTAFSCNMAKYVESNYAYGTCLGTSGQSAMNFWIAEAGTTLEAFQTWLSTNNLQVEYELTTPITMQFDPIALRSNGVTNISVNCGEVTECKYYSETP